MSCETSPRRQDCLLDQFTDRRKHILGIDLALNLLEEDQLRIIVNAHYRTTWMDKRENIIIK